MTSRHIINIIQILVWLALGSMGGWAISAGHRQHWLTLIMAIIFIFWLAADETDGESMKNTLINKNKNGDGRGD